MAKNIDTGIEKLKAALKREPTAELSRQWQITKSKLDVILLFTNTFKTDDVRKSVSKLDKMSYEERSEFIIKNWGKLYFEKCRPILEQLKTLESKM